MWKHLTVPLACHCLIKVKWRLMVTSCYRRMGNYQKALELYEKIHLDYPDNLECELARISPSKQADQGLTDTNVIERPW